MSGGVRLRFHQLREPSQGEGPGPGAQWGRPHHLQRPPASHAQPVAVLAQSGTSARAGREAGAGGELRRDCPKAVIPTLGHALCKTGAYLYPEVRSPASKATEPRGHESSSPGLHLGCRQAGRLPPRLCPVPSCTKPLLSSPWSLLPPCLFCSCTFCFQHPWHYSSQGLSSHADSIPHGPMQDRKSVV